MFSDSDQLFYNFYSYSDIYKTQVLRDIRYNSTHTMQVIGNEERTPERKFRLTSYFRMHCRVPLMEIGCVMVGHGLVKKKRHWIVLVEQTPLRHFGWCVHRGVWKWETPLLRL